MDDHDRLIRIDENLKHIVDKIDDFQPRLRRLEKWMNCMKGAIGLIGTLITLLLGLLIIIIKKVGF